MRDEKIILRYKNKEEILKKLKNWKYIHGKFCPICDRFMKSMLQRKRVIIEGHDVEVHRKCLSRLYQQSALDLLKKSKEL